MKKYTFVVLMLTLFTLSISAQKAEKISIDQLVQKHLESIGPADARSPSTSRVFVGKETLRSKLGSIFLLNGTAQLASVGDDLVFATVFDSDVYPYDKVGFDGKDLSVGLPNGKRTVLSNYIMAAPSIVKDGLFAGALSTAWPLLDLKANPKVKLEMAGTTKIDDRTCYKVRFSSAKSGQLRVTLYFDAETFRHVRSEYEYTIDPSIGRSPTDVTSSSRIQRFDLTEDFSDFKTAGKLTLPFKYNINITTQGQIVSTTGAISRDWTLEITQAYYDQALKPEMFHVS